jgi:hypothetical protein
MDDVRTALKRAGTFVTLPERSFERLLDRRDRVRRRQRRVTLIVAGLIAFSAVGGATFLLTGLDGRSEGTANGWEPSRPLSLEPGDYFYLRVTSSDLGDGHIRDEETWWATDASGQVRNRSTRQDKYPYPPSGTYDEGSFPTYLADVASLSTDPTVLRRELDRAPFDWQALLLEAPNATPELRAAVFDVAAGLDGVTMIEDAPDPAGRPAIALEISESTDGDLATWRTYFDPATHQAIAWTFESSRGGSARVLIESGIVDAPGERPSAAQWLFPPIPAW